MADKFYRVVPKEGDVIDGRTRLHIAGHTLALRHLHDVWAVVFGWYGEPCWIEEWSGTVHHLTKQDFQTELQYKCEDASHGPEKLQIRSTHMMAEVVTLTDAHKVKTIGEVTCQGEVDFEWWEDPTWKVTWELKLFEEEVSVSEGD